jgi:hypothetical protein
MNLPHNFGVTAIGAHFVPNLTVDAPTGQGRRCRPDRCNGAAMVQSRCNCTFPTTMVHWCNRVYLYAGALHPSETAKEMLIAGHGANQTSIGHRQILVRCRLGEWHLPMTSPS